MNKLHYLRFDTNSEEIVPIVFTDGSTLQKMNDKWIENSDKHVYVYNEIKIHDNEIHLEDKTRSSVAYIKITNTHITKCSIIIVRTITSCLS